jgi:REP element-mobilizing transposase RayT
MNGKQPTPSSRPPSSDGQEANRCDPTPSTLHIRHGAYLPHWEKEGAVYSVTFRLDDSLPQSVIDAWREERNAIIRHAEASGRPLSPEEQKRLDFLFTDRIDKFLDSGYGACWMNRDDVAGLVANALRHFKGDRYRLLAWCVMPNHVHVLLQPLPPWELTAILHSWKSFTSNEANRMLARSGPFWQTESYDHLIRDNADLNHAYSYILTNPAKAGLRQWKWVAQEDEERDLAKLLEAVRGKRA